MMAVKKICVLLALAGCSPEPAPLPAPRPSGPPSVFVLPPTVPAPPPERAEAPPRREPPAPPPMVIATPPAPMDIGRPGKPASRVQSPTFVLRGVATGGDVYLNGERAGPTPLRWWVSEHTVFDPQIAVQEWPPALGVPAAGGRFRLDGGGWTAMEVQVGRASAALRERWPHLEPGEEVLFVRATWPDRVMQGALRVRVPGLRWSSYVPTGLTEESPDAASQGRTLWFEPD